MLEQGLNYVKSRISEAAAQAQAESRPRPKTHSWTAAFVLRASFAVSKAGVGPKTYSWTAAFVLRASFAVAKCVACVSTCLHEESGNQRPLHLEFSACAQRYHATKNSSGLAPQADGSLSKSMRTETCSCKTTAAISRRPID